MKRKAILWLILLCTALILLSCDNSTPPNGTVTDCGAVTDTQPEQTDISIDIVKDGVAQYRIVRGEEADQVVVDAAVMIREKIGSVTGVTPDIGTDWVRRGTDLDHTAFEILIGDTAYPESDKAMEDLPYGDYIITQVDNKLVINSRSKEGMNRAVAKFLNMLTLQGKEENFSLPGDVRYTETAVEIVNCLPQYTDGDLLTIYPAGDRAQLLVCTDTTPEAYADYRKKLEAAGYVLHTETVITDNLFATYANDQYVVHAGYYAYEKAVRLTIEPRKAMPALPADTNIQRRFSPAWPCSAWSLRASKTVSASSSSSPTVATSLWTAASTVPAMPSRSTSTCMPMLPIQAISPSPGGSSPTPTATITAPF